MIRLICWFFVVSLLTILVFAGISYQTAVTSTIVEESSLVFEIKDGQSLSQVVDQLKRENIPVDGHWFKIIAYVNGQQDQLKSGEYLITQGMRLPELLALFVSGASRQHAITFPEGWSFKQIKYALRQHQAIKQTIDALTLPELLVLLKCPYPHVEGLLFPDTYFFAKGDSDLSILKRAYTKMSEVLIQEWETRDDDLPVASRYEALILASIIEKETAIPSERDQIAGVFIRRLRKKMRLQADPTVIYGLGEKYHGNIRTRDLLEDTPYNTYRHKGLTPTPIAMPGRGAIHAALHPAPGESLYFVASGNRRHTFSNSLESHNNAVNLYQKK